MSKISQPDSVNGLNIVNNYVSNDLYGIQDVWANNMEQEFMKIRQIIQNYTYVAMDTEFPGVVARPIGEFRSTGEYQYQLLRCNVDLLKIIQLGLTFLDANGNAPPEFSTWQFNFKFSLVSYDFGYLLKLLTDQNLPSDEAEFFDLLRWYFPTIYDVKYLMKSCKNLKGGLQEVADQLELERIGPQHQAGSDSLLTGIAFFKMREMFFEDNIDDDKYCGHLYGLGNCFIQGNLQDDALPVSSP
ncbi:CCR4-NOT transcription complex subunit 7-like isoform X3 [Stegodyphus dumicola]|uniref:CCR4-NOT transcription complex subunit 7-like isoform X3 n=1 Tax=Stegodyphus dumicola TaxID=202533 RepID=UPI0015A871D2|nr:CCR4-NOT transcription complex subunit 7-like isoform X3 [Stegodyphus dumicola]